MIDLKINFQNEAFKKIPLISPAIVKNLDNAVKQSAMFIRNTIIKKMREGGKGKLYKRYRGGKNPIYHRASAPGSAPATDTGRLIGSIHTNFPEIMKAEIGSNVNYSQYLELGTSKMAKRPWLISSLDENSQKISDLINHAIEDGLR